MLSSPPDGGNQTCASPPVPESRDRPAVGRHTLMPQSAVEHRRNTSLSSSVKANSPFAKIVLDVRSGAQRSAALPDQAKAARTRQNAVLVIEFVRYCNAHHAIEEDQFVVSGACRLHAGRCARR